MFYPFKPNGPFKCGIRDFSFCDGQPVLQPDKHCCGRIFYPTTAKPPNIFSRISNVCLWLPHICYGIGYTKFLFFWVRSDKRWRVWLARLGVQVALTVMGMLCGLSATYNAPLAARSLSAPEPVANSEICNGEASDGKDALPKPAAARGSSKGEVSGEEGEDDQAPHPLVFFSHGLAGNRNTYSSICIQLASLGFIVVAVEHADGTASTSRLAPQFSLVEDKKGNPQRQRQNEWLFYAGLGDEQAQVQKTRFRVQELRTALRLVEAMNKGLAVEGLWVSGAEPHSLRQGLLDTGSWLRGRVDLSRVAVAGHSYGGATAALAACEHYPEFKAAVAMDPWWGALPPDCPILASGSWPSQAPILVLGSHAWNTPHPVTQKMACNGERQEILLSAAAGCKSTETGMAAAGAAGGGYGRQARGRCEHSSSGRGARVLRSPRSRSTAGGLQRLQPPFLR